MGNSAASGDVFLGRKPWISYDDIKNDLKTGDLILFSARSYVGRSIRESSNVLWSHVGIIITPSFCEPLVLEACIDRHSLNSFMTSDRLLVSGCIQSLSSKIHSGLYDIVAVRKLKMRSHVLLSATTPGSDAGQELMPEVGMNVGDVCIKFSERENFILDEMLYKDEDTILCQLLDLSIESFSIKIHDHKRSSLLMPQFFDNKSIFASDPEDVKMIVSAEYVAVMYTALGLFERQTNATICKFKPFHFGSDSSYDLPVDDRNSEGWDKETYIWMDYPLSSADVSILKKVELPTLYPTIRESDIQNFFFGYNSTWAMGLKTGDLIFLREVSEVGAGICKMYNFTHVYTRVCMVLIFDGVKDVYLYDSPAFFTNVMDLKELNKKYLEGNIINLNSILQSKCLSSVGIRRLKRKPYEVGAIDVSQSPDAFSVSIDGQQLIHTTVEMGKSKHDPVRERLYALFENVCELDPNVRVDVSSILSGYFVTSAYEQLGIIAKQDIAKRLFSSANRYASKEMELDNFYYLSPLEVLMSH
ncbi:hypothetical protein AKO1_009343 [Acrasis kona]|uniref:Uncharacterized protein n=1 Tax=Acrasis kona TaxID=1008807 RepID=A0AAW2ZKE3_9EUKA